MSPDFRKQDMKSVKAVWLYVGYSGVLVINGVRTDRTGSN